MNARGREGQARVIQEVTNCVLIKNQSQYSLTDLEPPPCELSNDVGINLLGRPLQESRFFPTSFPIMEQSLDHRSVGEFKKIKLHLYSCAAAAVDLTKILDA